MMGAPTQEIKGEKNHILSIITLAFSLLPTNLLKNLPSFFPSPGFSAADTNGSGILLQKALPLDKEG